MENVLRPDSAKFIALYSVVFCFAGLLIGCTVEKRIMPLLKKQLKIGDRKMKSVILVILQVSLTALLAEIVRNLIKSYLPRPGGALVAASGGITFGLSAFMMQESKDFKNKVFTKADRINRLLNEVLDEQI